MDRNPTPDEAAGMAWWNGLSRTDRDRWLVRGGTAVVADAWKAYKQSQSSPSQPVTQPAKDVRIVLELADVEAWSLAQFLKRVGYSDFRSNAQDDAEASAMRDAAERVRQALADAGYAPR